MTKCQTPAERAHSMLRASGYATGGDVKQDKQMIRSAVRQHESAQHGGKHSPLKLARGGSVKKPSTTVNVIVAPGGASGDAQSLRGSMQRGMHAPPMGAGASPMTPPMAPPPAAPPPMNLGGPPLGMQPKPLGMGAPGGPQFKRGGKIPMKPMAKGGRAKGGLIMNDMKKPQDHERDFSQRLPPHRGLAPYSGQDRAMEKGPPTGRESGRVIKPGEAAERDEDFKRGGKIPMKPMGKGAGRRAGGGGVSKSRTPGEGALTGGGRAASAPRTPGEGALTGGGRAASAPRAPGIDFGEGALTGSGRASPVARPAPRPAPRVSRPTAGEIEADRLMDKWNTKDGVLPGGIVPKDDVLKRGGRVKKGAK